MMPMFVSYVDESGKGDPVFTVGGLTARAERWLEFSDAWQAALDASPKIPHFHLSDRQGLSEAEHNRKIDLLIPTINKYVERGDLVVVLTQVYQSLYQKIFSATLDNPFHFAYVAMFQQCAVHLPEEGKIDFVFDEIDFTQYAELLHAFETFSEACPSEEVKRRFNGAPVLRNDETTLPLQAADLWAGIMRRASLYHDAESIERLKQFTIEHRAFSWDEKSLGEHWRTQVKRLPALLTGMFYEGKRQRSKRLKSIKSRLLKI